MPRSRHRKKKTPKDLAFEDLLGISPVPRRQAEALEEAAVEGMVRAGIGPEKIYAFRRTGTLVSEDNWDLLTDEQRAEWVAALAEYEQQTQGVH
jgi:hypothetical protein